MSGGMKTHDIAVERVQQLVERAERLRMQSAAVPLKDLKAVLQILEIANEQRNTSATHTEPLANLLHSQV
jgi:RNA-binding protein YlmH